MSAALADLGALTGRELRRFEGHRAPVNAAAFSPDGRLALSAAGCITRPGGELAPIAPELGGTQPRLEQTIGTFRVTPHSGSSATDDAARPSGHLS